MKAAQIREPFHFSDSHMEKLRERFGKNAKGPRFIGDLQKVVGRHVSARDGHGSVSTGARAMRSNASAVMKAAKQLKKTLASLEDAEKGILGQLMWTVDKQKYAPAAFSVNQVTEAVSVLEQAASKLAKGGSSGRSSLQLEVLIRGVYAAYVVRFNSKPELSAGKDNDFTFALKVCFNAAGESTRTSAQLLRDAINA